MITFMEYLKALSEMPLANYRYQPAPEDHASGVKDFGGGYDDVDKAVLQKDSTSKKLEEVLARSTGHMFNILMLEFSNFVREPGTGMAVNTRKSYKPYIERYCKENGIPIEGHITFAKNKSTGDPLKPWMILHTIGHALTDEYPQAKAEIGAILKEMSIRHAQAHGQSYAVKNDEFAQRDVLARVFKFSSARRTVDQKTNKLQIRDFGEVIHELFAEYLWHGHIRYQIPQDDMRTPRGENDFRSDIHLAPWKGGDVAQDIKKIEDYIKDLLDKSVGKILIDWN